MHECLQIEMPCTYLMAQKTKGRIQSETKAFYVEIKNATGSKALFISFMVYIEEVKAEIERT